MMDWNDLPERFRKKVQVTGPGECWIWTGRRHPFGYGEYGIWDKSTKRVIKVRAHRYVFEQLIGPIPPGLGLFVCHRCDRGECCQPEHLFLTTHEGNVRDCVRKGRQAAGEGNGMAKLRWDQVEEIRRIYGEGGIAQHRLAKRYGVSQMTVSQITQGKYWRPLRLVD
jgi:DNA-binding XRE family transcriptional regulator